MIGGETPQTLEIILRQKQSGVSGQVICNQIIEFLQWTSNNANEVANRGYKQIEECNYYWYNREQTLIRWGDFCHRTLTELTGNIEQYVGQEVSHTESSILQRIREGSLNFRNEIEMYLGDVESTFVKLKEDAKVAMEQVSYILHVNDERNAKADSLLQDLLKRNATTQQLREQEIARREKETKDTNAKIESLMKVIERQQQVFATNQQKIKDEFMQERSEDVKVENGGLDDAGTGAKHIVPSGCKKFPPGVFDGGDERGLA